MIVGSIVALVTPMVPGSMGVDFPALARLIEWHIASGTDAIVAVGTTGESATLDMQEHLKVIEYCVETAAGRVPIIAGTGANSTMEAVELTASAHRVGADACLLVVPYYNKPTQQGLYAHFRAVAEAVPVPQILYNVPSRTACDMVADTVCQLALLENIVGIKEATGDLDRGREIIQGCSDDFAVYSGDDATAARLMLVGGKGNVSVTANIVPAEMHQLCHAAIEGDREHAEILDNKLAALHEVLFVEANPIPVKWALAEMGYIAHDAIRLPMTPLSDSYRDQVRTALRDMGLVS